MTTTAGATTPPPSAFACPAALFVWGRLDDPRSAEALAGALGGDLSPQAADDAALAALLEAGEPCAVIWADPAPALAAALADGRSPQQALADWQEAARGLLGLYRRHRRRLLLLPEAALASDDPETLAQLRARLGLDRPPAIPAPAEGEQAELTGLLARLAVRALEDLRPTLAELEAGSLYCPRPVLDAERLDRAGHWLSMQREKQVLLIDQLRLGQACDDETLRDLDRQAATERAREAETRTALETELAEARARAARAEAELAQLRKEQAETAARLAATGQDAALRETERDLLRDQVRLMTQALDADEAERFATLTELEQRRAAAQQADRALSRALAETRTAAEARSRAEAELTKLRLDAGRLRLEAEQLDETRAHADRMAADLARIHETLIARENTLAEREGELEELRTWSEAVFASNSWKITAPLRRASLMLGRHRP